MGERREETRMSRERLDGEKEGEERRRTWEGGKGRRRKCHRTRRKKAANTVRGSKDSKNREEDAEMKEEMHVSPAAV